MPLAPKVKPTRLLFEEKNSNEKITGATAGGPASAPSNFLGRDVASKFAATVKPHERDDPATNAFDKANYGVLVFDKKRQAFRLEPFHRHFLFEKEKNVDRLGQKLANEKMKALNQQ